MDEINNFFDFTREFERVPIVRSYNSGNVNATTSENSGNSNLTKREFVGTNYAEEYVKEEEKRMKLHGDVKPPAFVMDNDMMGYMELLSDEEEDPVSAIRTDDTGVYERYIFDLNRDDSLPIADYKNEILAKIRQHFVVVLQGDTGCGKTTQVPQYILDDCFVRGQYCNIVCTQPRRIAAMSICSRVCNERKWDEGTLVGYQVGLHKQNSEDTRMLFCTTGVLLEKLINKRSLSEFTHIILDEVHERDQDMDFLLIVIRRFLLTNSKNVKIILMSATIDSKLFANYFKLGGEPAPILLLDTRCLYKVSEFYLEDLQRINVAKVDPSEPNIEKEMYNLATRLIIVIDNLEKQEGRNCNDVTKGSILVFLPGINEIDYLNVLLQELNNAKDIHLSPIRLHSLIPPTEQAKIFNNAPKGYRKVILATNIAESSITVSDVKYVIDFCLTKTLVTDTATNFSSLQIEWASKANCRQRSGRAGRVMNGRVYRMVRKTFYETLPDYGKAEMLRCPLENVVLKAKLLNMGSPASILALALEAPNLSDITNTILLLKEAGALYLYVDEKYSTSDGDLTYMGHVMAKMPLDIHLTRLIMIGYIFSALDDAIIIAAGLSVRSIFRYNNGRINADAAAYIQKLTCADGSGSDLIAIMRAYKIWVSMCEQGSDSNNAENWSQRYYLNLRSLREMHALVQELRSRLEHFGIKDHAPNQHVQWAEREIIIILKIIIAGAFYPNYFTRLNMNNVNGERDIYHTIAGNNPCNTVYFTNFNQRNIGQLYVEPIKAIFKSIGIPPEHIEVRFPPGTERILITFINEPEDEQGNEGYKKLLVVPGQVHSEVYKAVRMRMLNMRTILYTMDPSAELQYACRFDIGGLVEGVWQPRKQVIPFPEKVCLPSIFESKMTGKITYVKNCSKFYFQPSNAAFSLYEIHQLLNNEYVNDSKFKSYSDVGKGMLVAARFGPRFQRAKVLQCIHVNRRQPLFKVEFIDFGYTANVDFENILMLPKNKDDVILIPPRCFVSRLAMVQPSLVKSPNGIWCNEANKFLQEMVDTEETEIEIYSIVGSVVTVILKHGCSDLSTLLVDHMYGQYSDESYMSKFDHNIRQRGQLSSVNLQSEDRYRQKNHYFENLRNDLDVEVTAPLRDSCTKPIRLRGPYSPLETKIYAAFHAGKWKSVHIEKESVNSVLVDTDPQDMHERLVVAASINNIQDSERIVARATTLMPNIHGFGALMALIFCPTMQIRRNKNKTKYSSIVVGLGYDETTYASLYPERDILMQLDADILPADLEIINRIRYYMDSIIYARTGDTIQAYTPKERADYSVKIKELIIRLLHKNRKYNETDTTYSAEAWGPYEEDIITCNNIYGKRAIFPLHKSLRLYDENYDHLQSLSANCRELHDLAKVDCSLPSSLKCLLCNVSLQEMIQLRIHLLSQLHRDREQQIKYQFGH